MPFGQTALMRSKRKAADEFHAYLRQSGDFGTIEADIVGFGRMKVDVTPALAERFGPDLRWQIQNSQRFQFGDRGTVFTALEWNPVLRNHKLLVGLVAEVDERPSLIWTRRVPPRKMREMMQMLRIEISGRLQTHWIEPHKKLRNP